MKRALDILCLVLALLGSALIALSCLPFYFISHRLGQKFHYFFGKQWLFLMGIHVTVIGRENLPEDGHAILAPNHESMFDIPLLSSLEYDFRWISKKQVGKIPFIGQSMRAMGCYFVHRDGSSKDITILSEVEQGLRNGGSVVIFPEGTRTRTGKLLPFKKGAFRTAQNAGAVIVPMAITGTRAIAEPGKWPSRGHSVTVRIGRPMPVPPTMSIPEAMTEYKKQLVNLLAKDRGSAYNPLE